MLLNQKKYKWPFMLLSAGLAFTLISAYFSVNSVESWFSRSGAILSFVSVVTQFILSDLRKKGLEKIFESSELNIRQKFSALETKDPVGKSLSIASGITGLLGTLIWGYGDLFF